MQQIGGDSRKVRGVNRELILDCLRTEGAKSLAELAVATGLSLATCSNIVAELAGEGAVGEEDVRESRGGRPARRFRFNPHHVLAATVMVRLVKGLEELQYRVVDAAGEIVASGTDKVPGLGPEDIDALLARLAGEYPALGAAAISVPGIVDRGVIELCDVPRLAGCEIVRLVKERRGLEAVVENDMNFAAIGFARSPRVHGAVDVVDTTRGPKLRKWGEGVAPFHVDSPYPPLAARSKGNRNFREQTVYMVFPGDVCAGAGLVVNGKLVKGKSNFAGEISFLPFAEDRERQRAKPGDRDWLVEFMAKAVITVTAVVNPDTVVLSGDAVSEDMIPGIERLCRERIPERHCPAVLAIPDYTEDCQAGMAAMALDCLRCDYQLVRKERTWCIDE